MEYFNKSSQVSLFSIKVAKNVQAASAICLRTCFTVIEFNAFNKLFFKIILSLDVIALNTLSGLALSFGRNIFLIIIAQYI